MEPIVYTYVSTRADYDPAKLLIVCPPSGQAGSREQAETFGVSSGWQTLAEAEGAVLLIPVVPEGWAAESTDLPARLYDTLRNSFSSRNGRSVTKTVPSLPETVWWRIPTGSPPSFWPEALLRTTARRICPPATGW